VVHRSLLSYIYRSPFFGGADDILGLLDLEGKVVATSRVLEPIALLPYCLRVHRKSGVLQLLYLGLLLRLDDLL